ncbi:lipoprotein [Streptomyces drozdowiczii]|uniref:Lipoprotein n=1 Tax=Streptomyces drozdowiczii TaxID=202862 RepID=A0ABY6PV42_9ACTN|nr:lipoprotein [Streptomyces drozdowiczii]MCX0244306.1 lipoprotein [Streptomyces drozdowiczii]UZK55900.1 lipoprotein [Streptomyces drozdowiczii]
MTRRTVRGLVPVLLAASALTGCSSEADSGGDAKPEKSAAPAVRTAAKGGTVGGAGSGCELPVTFDLAADWKPKAVEIDPDSDFAELAEQGPVTLACEIDAKPAGHVGFLRVWRAATTTVTPREALKGFVGADVNASGAAYKEVASGGQRLTEVVYTAHSDLMDENRPAHAFALATPDGPVVVHLGGLDADQHEGMLPAYELAKASVRVG